MSVRDSSRTQLSLHFTLSYKFYSLFNAEEHLSNTNIYTVTFQFWILLLSKNYFQTMPYLTSLPLTGDFILTPKEQHLTMCELAPKRIHFHFCCLPLHLLSLTKCVFLVQSSQAFSPNPSLLIYKACFFYVPRKDKIP